MTGPKTCDPRPAQADLRVDTASLDKVAALLADKSRQGFFGDVVVKFTGGRLVEVRVNEVIKPAEL